MASHSDQFREWASTIADLSGTMALLNWDRDTAMPASGTDTRAQQMSTLAALLHRELIRPELDDVLDTQRTTAEGDPVAAREVALLAHERARATRLPESLVRELSEAESRCVAAWIDAHPRGDWDALCGPLAHLVAVKTREAEALSDSVQIYDALLDGYEPGATTDALTPLFADLAGRLAPMILEAQATMPRPLPTRHWPHNAQMELAHEIAAMVGFDHTRGRLAESAHPFSTAFGAGDVRFTTRIDERDPISNILTVLHEVGHATYEQGLSPDYARTILHDAPSLGAHESQSRFWENHIGGTKAFWELIAPRMGALFPTAMKGIGADDLYNATIGVQPSLIRVNADEVTYNLHIVLRFELEVGLISGDISVDDLPEIWDARMVDLLGIRPTSPKDGVMQDVHWPDGMFGYFPTYTLGNLYAAQLATTLDTELGGLEARIAAGDLSAILGALRARVHRHGSLYRTTELMMHATGASLSADPLIAHLATRVQTAISSHG